MSFQVDDTTYNDNRRTIDLPNGLEQFRMNLVELLVDIGQLLGSALFIQKVMIAEFLQKYLSIWVISSCVDYGNLSILAYLNKTGTVKFFIV